MRYLSFHARTTRDPQPVTRIPLAPRSRLVALLLVVAASPGDPARADDWPQLQGRHGDGVARDVEMRALDGGVPDIAWEAQVGIGYASVSIVDHHLYTAGWAKGHTTVHCLDVRTGTPVWQQRYAIERYDRQHRGGPAGTPAVADGRVYHLSRNAELFCYRARDGAPLWSRRLMDELDVDLPRFAFTGSPIVHGDHVFVDVGRVAAFLKTSGRIVWQSDDYGAGYSTPRAFSWQGRPMLAAFPQAGLVVLDRASGKEHAVHPWTNPYGNNAVVPLVHDDRLFISSGDNIGGVMLTLTRSSLEVAWKAPTFRNKMATSILIDGHLYGFDVRVLKCLDAKDGAIRWTQRGLGMGTLTATADTLIILSEEGELVLADVNAKQFVARSRMQVLDHGPCWTVPVASGGRLFCRGEDGRLLCITLPGSS